MKSLVSVYDAEQDSHDDLFQREAILPGFRHEASRKSEKDPTTERR